MKTKRNILALSVASLTALSHAQTVEIGSDQFNEAIREYLLANPEVIFEAVDVYNAREEQAQNDSVKKSMVDKQAQIYDRKDAIIVGNPDAKFSVVEFVDYNCGFCRKSHVEIQQLIKNNPDVNILVRQLPILSQGSLEAAKIVLAVENLYGNDAALAIHDKLYEEVQDANEASTLALTEAAGHNTDDIKKEVQSQDVYNALAEVNEIAEALKIQGTPGFVIGDELIGGYIPLDTMQSLIDAKKG